MGILSCPLFKNWKFLTIHIHLDWNFISLHIYTIIILAWFILFIYFAIIKCHWLIGKLFLLLMDWIIVCLLLMVAIIKMVLINLLISWKVLLCILAGFINLYCFIKWQIIRMFQKNITILISTIIIIFIIFLLLFII